METTTKVRRRGLPRAEQVARNRSELLAAAGRVFRELGYSGASLDAIADAAGFSKGAVYSHFASKADLFLSLLESRIEERAHLQRNVAQTSGTTPLAFVEQMFAASRADPEWRLAVLEFRVVATRDPALRARYARAHRQTIAGIAESLRAMFTTLGIEPDLPIETLALSGLIFDIGLFLEELAADEPLPGDQLAAVISQLLRLTARGEP
jgi:AcrR family transcriptional regulator